MIPLSEFRDPRVLTNGDVVYVMEPRVIARLYSYADVTFEAGTPVICEMVLTPDIYEMVFPENAPVDDRYVAVSRPDSRFHYTVPASTVGVVGGE